MLNDPVKCGYALISSIQALVLGTVHFRIATSYSGCLISNLIFVYFSVWNIVFFGDEQPYWNSIMLPTLMLILSLPVGKKYPLLLDGMRSFLGNLLISIGIFIHFVHLGIFYPNSLIGLTGIYVFLQLVAICMLFRRENWWNGSRKKRDFDWFVAGFTCLLSLWSNCILFRWIGKWKVFCWSIFCLLYTVLCVCFRGKFMKSGSFH